MLESTIGQVLTVLLIVAVLVVSCYSYIPWPWLRYRIILDDVAQQIVSHNHSVLKDLPIYVNPIKGAVIHSINDRTAARLSYYIQLNAVQYHIPLTYLLASIAIESAFDPNADNANKGPGESNTADDPLGHDTGISQIKLKYLLGQLGVETLAEAQDFALDITKAIPYQCSLLAGDLVWAEGLLATPSSAPDPKMQNKYALASCSYNFGRTGAEKMFNGGEWPPHCQEVMDLEKWFAQELKVPSAYA